MLVRWCYPPWFLGQKNLEKLCLKVAQLSESPFQYVFGRVAPWGIDLGHIWLPFCSQLIRMSPGFYTNQIPIVNQLGAMIQRPNFINYKLGLSENGVYTPNWQLSTGKMIIKQWEGFSSNFSDKPKLVIATMAGLCKCRPTCAPRAGNLSCLCLAMKIGKIVICCWIIRLLGSIILIFFDAYLY